MYVHHYFPALYFAMISFAVLVDQFASRLPKPVGHLVILGFGVAIILVFLYFADLAFGMEGPAAQWRDRMWLSAWNIA